MKPTAVEGIKSATCRVRRVPLRVEILMDYPSPHMIALLDALAARQDIVAHVLYLDGHAPGRQWQDPCGRLGHSFLPGLKWSRATRLNPAILRAINRTRADIWVVNACYTSPTTLLAALWLNWKKMPWVYMNEPPRPRGRIVSTARQAFLSCAIRKASGLVGTGLEAENIYARLLSNHKPTESVPYYIDLEPFKALPLPTEPARGKPVQFVTSCQMIHRKGLDVLLEACQLLPPRGWTLAIAGDGPLRSSLESDFGRRWNSKQVTFEGQIPYEHRSRVFERKHVFVFPSRWDGWGMVVPEALAAGLPVISTDQVISAHEFIREEENGFIVPKEDPSTLANRMRYFLEHPGSIAGMGVIARDSVTKYSPDAGAERLVRLLLAIHQNNDEKSLSSARLAQVSSSPNWKNLTTARSWFQGSAKTGRALARKCIINLNVTFRPGREPNGNRILAYHLVLLEDKKCFEEHLKFLTDHYHICTTTEMLTRRCQGPKQGLNYAAITFDDGFKVLMTACLEILQKYGIRATFFVPAGFIGLSGDPACAAEFSRRAHHYALPLSPMSPEDVSLLSGLGHEIGSHGVSHVSLTHLSMAKAVKELRSSKGWVTKCTRTETAGFAYPYGDVHSSFGRPCDWIREAGYTYAVTLRRGKVNRFSDPYLLPRDHVEGNWSLRDLRYFLSN